MSNIAESLRSYSRLPPEIWLEIFGYLDYADLKTLPVVCNYLNTLISNFPAIDGRLFRDPKELNPNDHRGNGSPILLHPFLSEGYRVWLDEYRTVWFPRTGFQSFTDVVHIFFQHSAQNPDVSFIKSYINFLVGPEAAHRKIYTEVLNTQAQERFLDMQVESQDAPLTMRDVAMARLVAHERVHCADIGLSAPVNGDGTGQPYINKKWEQMMALKIISKKMTAHGLDRKKLEQEIGRLDEEWRRLREEFLSSSEVS